MEPITRVPIVQQVEDRIKELILSGQCKPGEKLPAEMELCQRLGVGRGTIREAFRLDRKSTRLNSSHSRASRMPSSA